MKIYQIARAIANADLNLDILLLFFGPLVELSGDEGDKQFTTIGFRPDRQHVGKSESTTTGDSRFGWGTVHEDLQHFNRITGNKSMETKIIYTWERRFVREQVFKLIESRGIHR